MLKNLSGKSFIIGILIAHLLMFLTYQNPKVFWYLITGTMLFLISYSILFEKLEDEASLLNYLLIGIISGIFIYGVFALGNYLINILDLPFKKQVASLYNVYSPTNLWQYILLILIVVPGEEFFWRGFVQKKLLNVTKTVPSVIISTLLYGSVQIYSGQFILVIAALVSGLIWGGLYAWKRSIPLVVVSHLTFSLMAFIFLPFK